MEALAQAYLRYDADRIRNAVRIAVKIAGDGSALPLLERGYAVANVEYHKIFKVYLRVKAPFWEEYDLAPNLWTDGPLGRIFAAGQDGEVSYLTCWINGDAADRLFH